MGAWLARNKDWIGALSSIVSMIAVLFAAWQFWLAREVLEAQATADALRQGRTLISQIQRTPEVAADVLGVPAADLQRRLFVQQVVSLYSEQYVANDNGILSDEHWKLFERELCAFYSRPNAKPIVDDLIARDSYPGGFKNVLASC